MSVPDCAEILGLGSIQRKDFSRASRLNPFLDRA